MASSGSGSFNVAIPVGILGAIVVAMFVFIWWWFPRHWRKGVAMDMAEVDENRRQRELHAMRERTGSETSTEVGVPVYEPAVAAHAVPPPKYDEEMAMGAVRQKDSATIEVKNTANHVSPPATS